MAVGTVNGRMQILEVVGNLVRRTNRINEVDNVMVRQPIHAENVVMSSHTEISRVQPQVKPAMHARNLIISHAAV
jgi:hypothetical protein